MNAEIIYNHINIYSLAGSILIQMVKFFKNIHHSYRLFRDYISF